MAPDTAGPLTMPEHTGTGERVETFRLDLRAMNPLTGVSAQDRAPHTSLSMAVTPGAAALAGLSGRAAAPANPSIFGPIQPERPADPGAPAPPTAAPHTASARFPALAHPGARRPLNQGGGPTLRTRPRLATTSPDAQPPGGTTTVSATAHNTPQDTDDKLTERRQLVADIRAFADYLEEHPDLPVGHVYATPPWDLPRANKRTPRDQALNELAARARAAGSLVQLNARTYDIDYEIEIRFGNVRWSETWPRDVICVPRIEDGAVIYDPPNLDELRERAPETTS